MNMGWIERQFQRTFQLTEEIYADKLSNWQRLQEMGIDIVPDVLRAICTTDEIFIDPSVSRHYTSEQQVEFAKILLDVWRFEKNVPGLPEDIAFILGRVVDRAEMMEFDGRWNIRELYDEWSKARELADEIVNPSESDEYDLSSGL